MPIWVAVWLDIWQTIAKIHGIGLGIKSMAGSRWSNTAPIAFGTYRSASLRVRCPPNQNQIWGKPRFGSFLYDKPDSYLVEES